MIKNLKIFSWIVFLFLDCTRIFAQDCLNDSQKILGNKYLYSKNGYYGVVDSAGKILLPFEFDWIQTPSNSFFIVSKNGKYGTYNLQGKAVLPCQFDVLSDFYEGQAVFK